MVFLLDSTLLVHLVTNKKACKSLIYKPFRFCALYRERDLNPHSHHWPKDFLTTLTFTYAISVRFCSLDYFMTILLAQLRSLPYSLYAIYEFLY